MSNETKKVLLGGEFLIKDSVRKVSSFQKKLMKNKK